jgi:hypothetical protein
VVWTTRSKDTLAELGLRHWSFEFVFACVFGGAAGQLESEMLGWLSSTPARGSPKMTRGVRGPVDTAFARRALCEAALCLAPHGAHGNEDFALASSSLAAVDVARAMARAASSHGIEARILRCSCREYELWSHDTKLPDCESEIVAPDTSRTVEAPGRPGAGTLGRHPLHFEGRSEEP